MKNIFQKPEMIWCLVCRLLAVLLVLLLPRRLMG